jgi:hypothetical protein
MSLFSGIEKTIERGFQRWTEKLFGAADSNELLVVHRQILEEIETKVETMARGRRVFPFSHLTITVASPDPNRRAILETAFGERLENDIREALEGARCEVPRGFSVDIETVESGPAFDIQYSAQRAPAKAVAQEPPPFTTPRGRLIVVKGKTDRAEYALEKPRTNIGRLAELTDAEQRVIRRNDIVFEEGGDEANSTVSRRHAHIRFEAGEYRLCDDESEFGTRVFRGGRGIEVPAGNRRGEKLRPGDEIYLGRACLRFEE